MSKRFKQVSTGLTLVCNREDVIKQYVKLPFFLDTLSIPREACARLVGFDCLAYFADGISRMVWIRSWL